MEDHRLGSAGTFTSLLRSFISEGIFRLCAGNIIRKMNYEKKELILCRVSMMGEVENRGEPTNTVSKWLDEVQDALDELETLEKRIEKESRLLGICGMDHKTYWKYADMIDKLYNLKFCRPACFSYISLYVSLEDFASGYFVCFKSTNVVSGKLFRALKCDDSSRVIGLYGRSGSGKTTLVKLVAKKSRYEQIFDKIAFATVSSKNINVRRIQDEIALSLNLELYDQRESDSAVRAATISSALESSSARILVILDDVQAKFELEDIGIPPRGNYKILLTTRRQRECNLMACQKEIHMQPLSKEEAWRLFRKHSGIDEDDDDNSSSSHQLLNVAQEVAFECEGLPGKIEKMGSSLRSQPIEVWKTALDNFKHSKGWSHIFLSSHKQDTRYSFTDFLYHDLCKKGFKTFINNNEEEEEADGEEEQISPSLIQAIETSWLSIVVLSENYAYSSQCLNELVKILERMEMKKQIVLPIFYKVEPSDIRHQQNSYGKAMAEHEKRFADHSLKIQKWRSALFEVSNLSGQASKTGYEYKFIQKIIEEASNSKAKYDLEVRCAQDGRS